MGDETSMLGDEGHAVGDEGHMIGNETQTVGDGGPKVGESETTHSVNDETVEPDEQRRIHATRGLIDVLLDMAEDAEPQAVNLVLAPTPAGEFDSDLGLDPETPVLTHFYMAEAGQSVSAVFGMDLGTPAGRGRARFLTHPQGPFKLTERDDLAAVVLLAVPPWEDRTLAAFDRAGRKLELVIVDAEPPKEELA
ncbi:hypothetical protein E6P09_10915 [Haloferax mediterranei ATCC 33500]|uniref:Uncharacterized protein n=1 Tax=Haloferax mediterranei (strain ATCC 33500 / DSM 1411 / JCM 8866 / NBRC 14739 / NCIMB 2177 / R-4) TaxID=523841 RepID=I3R4X3_HALMT|nr:hypothetical protein [Haloferax mediterranei]AFK19283.1 hypothetical protein HFX_1577 [Haloferax mediterranei ATCC 33500]AHZ21359.1 hypothetical protein BM92_01230 [Haloferax mediterranei ATCC 33500]EMA04528.1 hypothetical protein C439_02597 [Haloferax mediterranei ATCC 33500]MDX5989386.1 hypothetical protein [Haloferax mediterranei ATCC 33500]QCQ75750.1 hypothetical protein E6P09_10915 [Haloferax mediterranei ATCC 33500]